MNKQNRRAFLQASTAAAFAAPLGGVAIAAKGASVPLILSTESLSPQSAPSVTANLGKKPLRLGLIIGIGKDPDAAMAKVRDLGLPTSPFFVDEIEPDLVGRLRRALETYQIAAAAVFVGGPGNEVCALYQGPLAIRLVPRETRAARIAHIKNA